MFKEPHFNVMDGLDIYIDDYTVFEPISPEVMATLSSWKTIMNPPQQVVTNGGYAVDVESEEGKAVLAARAELAQANAALQPSECDGVEVPSPAARSDRHVAPGSGAEGEGAKPHTRYGKRVGDFSASTYAAEEQAARDSETAEPTATPIAAPKSICQ